jgi:AcrR family transcriptional regulator
MSGAKMQTKRELIREAGVKIFSQKGFHKTKIEEIAQEAGIGKGTVYEYFQSKEQLFKEIIREEMESFDAQIRQGIGQHSGTREKLKELMRQCIKTWQRFQPLIRSTMIETSLFDVPFRNWLIKQHHQRLLYIKEIVEEGIARQDIKGINGMLFARLFYGGMSFLLNPFEEQQLQPAAIEDLLEETMEYYLNGIKN